jgi:hypothetical protein
VTHAIRLEAATICQLACPLCPTPEGTIKARIGAGFLKLDAFRRLVDANPHVSRIELSNWGEIFLNPEIEGIIEYGYRKSVGLTAWNGANMNHVRENVLEALARYRFRALNCSIDGVTQETYAAYRRKGDVARVLDNIRRLNDYKRRWRTEYPRLQWQFVWFEHNAHEVDAARALAAELGMSFQLKQNWADSPTMATVNDQEVGTDPGATPVPARPTPQGEDKSMRYCAQLWDEPQINFDGKLLGCCVNTWGTFGPNVFEVGLQRALDDEKYRYAKRMLRGEAPARDDVPCVLCDVYLRRAHTGDWQTEPTEHGIGPFLRRHGMGRAFEWTINRFERPLLPVMRAFRLAVPAPATARS